MKNIAAILVIFSSTVFKNCLCHPDGAPASRCESMMPNHGVDGQTGTSPYEVKVEKTYYMPGENVKVSIESSTENIKGFLIEARKVGENSVIGMFKTPPTNTKYVTCNATNMSAVTHSQRLALMKIDFEWEPDMDLAENITFFATVVKDKDTFWVKLQSPELYMHVSIESPNTVQTSMSYQTMATKSDVMATKSDIMATKPEALATTAYQAEASATIAPTKSTMYSTPVMSSTVNSTCKYADKAKCDGIQLHHNIVFLFFMGIFLTFWQN